MEVISICLAMLGQVSTPEPAERQVVVLEEMLQEIFLVVAEAEVLLGLVVQVVLVVLVLEVAVVAQSPEVVLLVRVV